MRNYLFIYLNAMNEDQIIKTDNYLDSEDRAFELPKD